MAKRVVIHAGFPKTGTTALQASLMQAKSELASQGIHFNPPWNNAHHRAAWAITDYTFGWESKGGEKTPISAWQSLCKEVSEYKGTALISSEFLIHAKTETINRIKQDLGIEEIQVVFTMRPFAKLLPSRYQQSLKKGRTWTFEEWLKKAFSKDETKIGLTDYAEIIENWANVFGSENIKLVIADESSPENLYRGFESSVGIQTQTLKPASTKRLNRSLTSSEVEILRQINLRKPKKWKWRQYNTNVRGKFVRELSDNKSKFPDDPKLQVPDWVHVKILPYAERQISAISKLGINVHGELESLNTNNVAQAENRDSAIPAEMVADIVIGLSSIKSLSETRTRDLVREILARIKKRFK